MHGLKGEPGLPYTDWHGRTRAGCLEGLPHREAPYRPRPLSRSRVSRWPTSRIVCDNRARAACRRAVACSARAGAACS